MAGDQGTLICKIQLLKLRCKNLIKEGKRESREEDTRWRGSGSSGRLGKREVSTTHLHLNKHARQRNASFVALHGDSGHNKKKVSIASSDSDDVISIPPLRHS